MALNNPLVIPKQMINKAQWVLWGARKEEGVPLLDKEGRLIKIPYRSTSTSSKSWRPFQDIMAEYETGMFNGVGYVLHQDSVVCIDLDYCISSDFILADYVYDILSVFNPNENDEVFVEYGPSGDGLHIWCLGNPVVTGSRFYEPIEVYGTDVAGRPSPRFVSVTGDTLFSSSFKPHKLSDRTKELAWLQEKYGLLSEMVKPTKWNAPPSLPTYDDSEVEASCDEVTLPDMSADMGAEFANEPDFEEYRGYVSSPQEELDAQVQADAEYFAMAGASDLPPIEEPVVRVYTNYVNSIVESDSSMITGSSLRNKTLFKVGCNFYRMGHSEWTGRTWGELRGVLTAAATAAGLPLNEVSKTLKSVEKSANGQTRQPPKD
ncbi:MAG: hypothetical protein DRR19_18925 [Candidatus Parabeggiatoa sp. nov. 1]|nr:MAG: hypothetical protein DRR19_18925 [Gammaproteobacteria bacterium]